MQTRGWYDRGDNAAASLNHVALQVRNIVESCAPGVTAMASLKLDHARAAVGRNFRVRGVIAAASLQLDGATRD